MCVWSTKSENSIQSCRGGGKLSGKAVLKEVTPEWRSGQSELSRQTSTGGLEDEAGLLSTRPDYTGPSKPRSNEKPLMMCILLYLLQHLAQCLEHPRCLNERVNDHHISQCLFTQDFWVKFTLFTGQILNLFPNNYNKIGLLVWLPAASIAAGIFLISQLGLECIYPSK